MTTSITNEANLVAWAGSTIGWDDPIANSALLNDGTWVKTNGFSSNAGYGLSVLTHILGAQIIFIQQTYQWHC